MQLPMYIGTARRKTSRSKPDRVFRQSLREACSRTNNCIGICFCGQLSETTKMCLVRPLAAIGVWNYETRENTRRGLRPQPKDLELRNTLNVAKKGKRTADFTDYADSCSPLTYTSTLDIPCSMLVLSAVEGSNIQIILTLIPCCPDPHPLLSWFPIRLSPLLACWLGFVGFGTWNLVDFV